MVENGHKTKLPQKPWLTLKVNENKMLQESRLRQLKGYEHIQKDSEMGATEEES